jgi:hypothetical protein
VIVRGFPSSRVPRVPKVLVPWVLLFCVPGSWFLVLGSSALLGRRCLRSFRSNVPARGCSSRQCQAEACNACRPEHAYRTSGTAGIASSRSRRVYAASGGHRAPQDRSGSVEIRRECGFSFLRGTPLQLRRVGRWVSVRTSQTPPKCWLAPSAPISGCRHRTERRVRPADVV